MELQVPKPSADLMIQMLKADPKRITGITSSSDPVKEVENLANEAMKQSAKENKQFQAAYVDDRKIYRTAVYVLGLLALISAIGAITLALKGVDLPESVVALGAASVGALVGLFAKSPTSN